MAWNEPGGNKRDPWSGGGRNSGGDGPDFERWLKSLSERINRLFGGGRSRGGGGSRGTGGGAGPGAGGILLIALGALLLWSAFDAFVVIEERERGVIMRFGKFDRQMNPGLNFKWPRPIEELRRVDFTTVRSVTEQARMLTRDENLVVLKFNVQFRVADPMLYQFATRDPDDALRQTAESAVRQVVGANTLDEILIGNRAALVIQVRDVLQTTLNDYRTGIEVNDVNFQEVEPPQEVKAAFDDAISAREDKERLIRASEAYASRVVPEARGEAARITLESEGYREATIARAEGEAARFTLLHDEYRLAPEVTRQRLLLETMEDVLARNPKVMIDVREGSQSMLYLPLDQILKERQHSTPVERGAVGTGTSGGQGTGQGAGASASAGNSRSNTGRESRR
ncbi:MAG: FtsH protease activity modulator HflK [Xanthomonadales bacterium]|nr:FtsH protease activity modulator HflK [Xanthomonadales bacterium]